MLGDEDFIKAAMELDMELETNSDNPGFQFEDSEEDTLTFFKFEDISDFR